MWHPQLPRRAKALCVIVALPLFAACTNTTSLQPDFQFAAPAPTATILLMPADVELAELTAGGLLEPKSDWTNQARGHLNVALQDTLNGRTQNLVTYRSPGGSNFTIDSAHFDLVKLHETVGDTIVTHKFTGIMPLPTQPGFDWGLGPNVKLLADEYNAEYVLFTTFHDSFSSAGRVAAQIAAALILGVGLPGGQQRAYASLVEVESGEIIWFSRLASTGGDLREEDGARKAVTELFEDMPK